MSMHTYIFMTIRLCQSLKASCFFEEIKQCAASRSETKKTNNNKKENIYHYALRLCMFMNKCLHM